MEKHFFICIDNSKAARSRTQQQTQFFQHLNEVTKYGRFIGHQTVMVT